jgi:mannose-6-phosphate isomerase-like protein (cupin superfamily)
MMKRLFSMAICGALAAGYLAGAAARPAASSASAAVAAPPAQAAAAATGPLQPPASLYWPREELLKLHTQLQQRVAAGQRPNGNELITLPPGWRLNHRVPGDMVDDAEEHEKVTDFFIIIAGTGVVGVGGVIEKPRPLTNATGPIPGETRGWPIKNGQVYKVKAGDMVHLPPHTAHWANGDAGGMTFLLVKHLHE